MSESRSDQVVLVLDREHARRLLDPDEPNHMEVLSKLADALEAALAESVQSPQTPDWVDDDYLEAMRATSGQTPEDTERIVLTGGEAALYRAWVEARKSVHSGSVRHERPEGEDTTFQGAMKEKHG